jgi:hypothetical protein
MEDYEEQLHGVEDDFHSQFAAELEVLAELEGGRGYSERGGVVAHQAVREGFAEVGSGRAQRRGRMHRRRRSVPVLGGCCKPLYQQGRRPWSPPGTRCPPRAGPGGRSRKPSLGGTLPSAAVSLRLQGTPGAVPGSGRWMRMSGEWNLCTSVCLWAVPGHPGWGWGLGMAFSSLRVSAAPKVKRPRLEVVKRLNFGPDAEELQFPDSPPEGITPPPSPEVPPELWNTGCVACGTGSLPPSSRETWKDGVHWIRPWEWRPVGSGG